MARPSCDQRRRNVAGLAQGWHLAIAALIAAVAVMVAPQPELVAPSIVPLESAPPTLSTSETIDRYGLGRGADSDRWDAVTRDLHELPGEVCHCCGDWFGHRFRRGCPGFVVSLPSDVYCTMHGPIGP